MTLHASKGLEFPYVYMVGMEEVCCPTRPASTKTTWRRNGASPMWASPGPDRADFTLCKERRQYGESVRPEPSRFLLELPQDDLEWENQKKVTAEERQQRGLDALAQIRAQHNLKKGRTTFSTS